MFSFCISLVSLKLDNFNTSSVTNMNWMFNGCYLLKSLNLNNFNTSSVMYMEKMFYNCFALKTLYLDNFNTSSIKNPNYIFYGCSSLVSLNLTNFDFTTSNFDSMFEKINDNFKYCIDDNKKYEFLDLLKNYEENCEYICMGNSKRYIREKSLCVDYCFMNDRYKYEYNFICYESCPSDTELIENTYFCKLKDENDTIYIIGVSICGSAIVIIIFLILCNRMKSKMINHSKQQIERYDAFSGEKKDKDLILIIFTYKDEKFIYSIDCKKTDIVKDIIEEKLYEKYPQYRNPKYYFECKGKIINIRNSFKSNKIGNRDIIEIKRRHN